MASGNGNGSVESAHNQTWRHFIEVAVICNKRVKTVFLLKKLRLTRDPPYSLGCFPWVFLCTTGESLYLFERNKLIGFLSDRPADGLTVTQIDRLIEQLTYILLSVLLNDKKRKNKKFQLIISQYISLGSWALRFSYKPYLQMRWYFYHFIRSFFSYLFLYLIISFCRQGLPA